MKVKASVERTIMLSVTFLGDEQAPLKDKVDRQQASVCLLGKESVTASNIFWGPAACDADAL